MSFREMRRFRQQLSKEECKAALDRGTSGVLAVTGDEGWPYAVPLSYVYEDGALFFHCAASGHKLDALRRDGRASFCVIDQDRVIPEKFTTAYRSVIAFGSVRMVEDERELRAAAEKLGRRYYPGVTQEELDREISDFLGQMCILEMTIEHMTGKEGKETIMERSK